MNRRKFIKQSGLLAGGLLLNNTWLQAFAANASGKKITVGIIGCGDRGKGLMEVLKELNDKFTVTAICDVLDFRLEEAKKVDQTFKVATHHEYRALLDDNNIEAVVIATPLHLHHEMAITALKAGKHVYLEKIMAYSVQQVMDIVKQAKQHPRQILQVGHQDRYTPMCFKVKWMIEKDYLGKVTEIDCRWDRNGNWRRPVPAGISDEVINWRMYKKYSGGLVAELLSHQIDFINWVFNTHPDEIFATGGIDYYKDGRETFDNVQVMVRYDKEGMIGNFGATCGNAFDGCSFKIKGTKGTVQLLMEQGIYFPEKEQKKKLETTDGVSGATKIVWNKDGGIPIINAPMKEGTRYAFNEFYECVTKNKIPVSNVITSATTATSVHLANKAMYNHTIEKWLPEYNYK
jgi:predicted dehydrogenase